MTQYFGGIDIFFIVLVTVTHLSDAAGEKNERTRLNENKSSGGGVATGKENGKNQKSLLFLVMPWHLNWMFCSLIVVLVVFLQRFIFNR